MKSAPLRSRARRGNADDHAAIRDQILEAAFRLHLEQGGLSAISMRSLATEVGLSAMGLYRYFESKTAVLQAMWEVILTEALEHTTAQAQCGKTARERLRLSIEGFIGYWEQRPDNFRLVYMTEELLDPTSSESYTQSDSYQAALRLGPELIDDFIAEVGGFRARRLEARDLRMALMVGYLHARLINRRFPWNDIDALRAHAVQTIMLGIEMCVLQPAPRASRRKASP